MREYKMNPFVNFIVFCGPDIQVSDYEKMIGHEISDTSNYNMVVFPETTMGADATRKLVNDIVAKKQRTVFITRYDVVLSELGCLIGGTKSDLKYDDVLIILYNKDKNTIHSYTKEGYVTDNWPLGVLG
jgi:hypothetical protein